MSTLPTTGLSSRRAGMPQECGLHQSIKWSGKPKKETGLQSSRWAIKPTESPGQASSPLAPRKSTTTAPTRPTGLTASRWVPTTKPDKKTGSEEPKDGPEHRMPEEGEPGHGKPEGEEMTGSEGHQEEPKTGLEPPTKLSWADLVDEELEQSASTTTTTTTSSSEEEHPATPPTPAKTNKACAGMLSSRWAIPNYEPKPAQSRAEYRATHRRKN